MRVYCPSYERKQVMIPTVCHRAKETGLFQPAGPVSILSFVSEADGWVGFYFSRGKVVKRQGELYIK
jgi:hypothetical protein